MILSCLDQSGVAILDFSMGMDLRICDFRYQIFVYLDFIVGFRDY